MAELWFVDARLETPAFARDKTITVVLWLCPQMELNRSCRHTAGPDHLALEAPAIAHIKTVDAENWSSP
jgi:hypothetical protein